MKGRMTRTAACAQCGRTFHPRYNSARRYCSVECAGLTKVKNTFAPARTAEERATAQVISKEMTDALAEARAREDEEHYS